MFFFVEKVIEFHFSKIDPEEEYPRRQKKLLDEIIPPIINKIPKSGQSELVSEILSYLDENYQARSYAKYTDEKIQIIRHHLMSHLFISLSLLVSRNYQEIFFPEKNPEDIEKDIEKGCSEVVNFIFKKEAELPVKFKILKGETLRQILITENFISIIFSIWGRESELILTAVFDYFSGSLLLEKSCPEFLEGAIMDMKRLIVKKS